MIGGGVWAWLLQGHFLEQNDGHMPCDSPVRLKPSYDSLEGFRPLQKIISFTPAAQRAPGSPDQHPQAGLKLEERL